MKKYNAVIFDLFGTVIHFDETLLPVLKLQNEEIHCTTVPLYELASSIRNGHSLESFHQTLSDVVSRLRLEKTASLKEISCLTRMKTLLKDLHFPDNEKTDQMATLMKNLHMGWMKKCVFLPDGYYSTLKKLKPDYRLGLLSNFDDAQTGYRILEDLQIDRFFGSILFSEEAGWIKPNPHLYEAILSKMNVNPSETVFVGDTPLADIIGPKQLGMDTVWINPDKYPFPENEFRPDYEIRHLSELVFMMSHQTSN